MLSVLCQYNYCCLYIPNTRTKSHHQIILPSVLFLILLITATISLPISPHFPSVVTQFHQVHCHSENYYELVSGHAVFLQCLKYTNIYIISLLGSTSRQYTWILKFKDFNKALLCTCWNLGVCSLPSWNVNLLKNLNCDSWPIEYRLCKLESFHFYSFRCKPWGGGAILCPTPS